MHFSIPYHRYQSTVGEQGASHTSGASYYVPGTGETLVRLPIVSSPVPETFTPKLGRILLPAAVGKPNSLNASFVNLLQPIFFVHLFANLDEAKMGSNAQRGLILRADGEDKAGHALLLRPPH